MEAIGLVARPFDPGQWAQTVINRDSSGPLLDGLWGLFPRSTAIGLDSRAEISAGLDLRAGFQEGHRHLSAHALASVQAYANLSGGEVQVEGMVQVDASVVTQDGVSHRHEMEFHSPLKPMPFDESVSLLRVFLVTPATHRSTAQFVLYLSHAINVGAKDKPIELLRMFDPQVKDVLISRSFGHDAIRVDHAKNGIVDLSTFGDGMRRAFAMSLALSRASGGILLVDEIESAIHTRALGSMLPWLVRAAEAADVQIVATTHSLEAVDAVLGAFKDADPGVVAYHLRRTAEGHACRRYDLAASAISAKRGSTSDERARLPSHRRRARRVLPGKAPHGCAPAQARPGRRQARPGVGAHRPRPSFRTRARSVPRCLPHVLPGPGRVRRRRERRRHRQAREAPPHHHETLARNGVSLDAVGVVLDADFEHARQKSPGQRVAEMAGVLAGLGLSAPRESEAVTGTPRTGIFVLPGAGALGTLEDVLLECAALVYPTLGCRAVRFIDGLDRGASDFVKKDLEEITKPSGRHKAVLAAMSAVLKPGKPIQASLEDHRWIEPRTLALPRVAAVLRFLQQLLGVPSTSAAGAPT